MSDRLPWLQVLAEQARDGRDAVYRGDSAALGALEAMNRPVLWAKDGEVIYVRISGNGAVRVSRDRHNIRVFWLEIWFGRSASIVWVIPERLRRLGEALRRNPHLRCGLDEFAACFPEPPEDGRSFAAFAGV